MLNRTNQRISYYKYLRREIFQSNQSPYYFAYGRTALKQGLLQLNLQNTSVLIPEYICKTVTSVFKSLGISIIYYPVNLDLSPKWDVIETLYTEKIKSILMVHYFGNPQSIDNFIQFTSQKNILLLEDNSHGSFGTINNQILGTFGDIGIASPRKSFPIINGGILYSKKDISWNNFPLEPVNIPKAIIKNLIGGILDYFPKIKSRLNKREYSSSEIEIADFSFDNSSFQIIIKDESRNKNRVSIFNIWNKWTVRNGLKPLFPKISESIAPMCFPILCNSNEQKEAINQFCIKHDIASFSWPDLPDDLLMNVNSGIELYDRIICLPIHNGMDIYKMDTFLSKLKFNCEL